MSPALFFADVVGSGPRNWHELAWAWNLDPGLILGLALAAWVYATGAREWRSRVRPPLGLSRAERACFWFGWASLGAALLSPIDAWGHVLFAAHMAQHELLMLAAAPLLVLGRPWVALMFALPRDEARWLARRFLRPSIVRVLRALGNPVLAWSVHAAALWVWHVPALFQATQVHRWVHDLQHVSFFGSALWFWWALWQTRPGWSGGAAALLYLFTTMVHTGVLGALLLFAEQPLYPIYGMRAETWSLSPLEDQQLGGLIMWVPAGLVYIAAALLGVVGWLRAAERRAGSPSLVAVA